MRMATITMTPRLDTRLQRLRSTLGRLGRFGGRRGHQAHAAGDVWRFPAGTPVDAAVLRTTWELLLSSQPAIPYLLTRPSDGATRLVVGENVTRLLGHAPTAAAAADWWDDAIHPEDRDLALQRRAVALQGGPAKQTYRFRAADGRYRILSDELRLTHRNARVVTAVGIFTDVTQRHEIEAAHATALCQLQKEAAVGKLASGVAHDFNNVLTAIRAYCDLVIEDLGTRHPLAGDVSAIQSAARDATALVKQLLGLSRPQPATLAPLEVNALIRGFEGMLRRMIPETIELRLALDPAAGRVLADRCLLEHVLLNLVANARDAMSQGGGRVVIRTESVTLATPLTHRHGLVPAGRYAVIAVEDTGCGMDDATQRQAFEMYFTTKEPGKGTGLGLSTTYGFVKQCGGHILLESECGRGTRVRIFHSLTDRASMPECPVRRSA